MEYSAPIIYLKYAISFCVLFSFPIFFRGFIKRVNIYNSIANSFLGYSVAFVLSLLLALMLYFITHIPDYDYSNFSVF
jgi:hypothetical protein